MYAELHAISNYTFLRGASHPHELVEQAALLGYKAIAITDECSFAGIVKAYEAAKKQQIKLLVGAEFQLAEGVFVLLAMDRRGYGQISQLITTSRRRAAKGEYQLHFSELKQGLERTILLWQPTSLNPIRSDLGDLSPQLEAYQTKMLAIGQSIRNVFAQRCYLLMERSLVAGEALKIQLWTQIASQLNMACVAAGNVRMHCEQRQKLQDILTCIRYSTELSQAGDRLLANAETALKPMSAIYKRYPKAWIDNSLLIAAQCDFCLDELKYEYPSEVVPSGLSASQYLAQEVYKGAMRRFNDHVPTSVTLQYEKELILIKEMQYEYFFLTIFDIVQYAKLQQILHQGRGSAANSVVCYCLGITEVDPTKVNMLFERFVSKERNEPPDIDVDFEHERREEIIQYIYRKYGRERAALAATVISYRFKSALADVGKALGIDKQHLDHMQHSIDRRDSEADWLTQLQDKSLVPTEGMGKHLLPLVQSILGFPRHLSQHVGGFIISSGPLSELVPVENAAMADRTVIQWDKDDLESLGLLKVDVLALGMLTAIRKCFQLLSTPKHNFTMDQVEWEQAAVYNMLQRGDSIGVFQVESRAQTSMLPRLKPRCYYDLVVQIAIVRPGPIQGDMVHPYLRRRDGLEKVTYPSKEVESVLSRTMGVPIFQEQVIKLAMVAAGFSGGEADQLRRAMASWKRSGELQQFEGKLLNGMQSRGYTAQFSQQIYKQIKGFGEYGFPESHSASFALLAYVSAYLKYHYPAAFCCSLLNSQPMGFYSPSQLIQDAQRHGVVVLPVCINQSQWQHTLVAAAHGSKAIRLGFRLVKGLNRNEIDKLMEQRPEQGFSHIDQIYQLGIARHELETLASADAFIKVAGHRHQVRWQLSACQPSLPLFDNASEFEGEPPRANNIDPQARAVLFKAAEVMLPCPSIAESMQADYAYTGVTLGQHPMSLLRDKPCLQHCLTAEQLDECRSGQVVTVAGLVVGRQRPGTASGVTFITLEDETGNVNLIVWSATARAQRQAYLVSKIMKVSGILERKSGVTHVVAGKLIDISTALNELVVRSRDFH
ncbi:error-prone DNA polymerase [Shewanella sp. Choline-02u-19]|uniref:error-prone DNA polymerase n=1 Tax=unclassified Shewanella TaxID=196818 RepID=UPI000C3376BF|nr:MULTISPECIES: error-prone DNA polymerase [unclassified Shewanella]PKH56182.1 error-prone DNA polymerase [Shewanella sp. Bg11-22]PKI27337.1 error-prone DNA polymerase [Shewanella sp. Choline-02u-19]